MRRMHWSFSSIISLSYRNWIWLCEVSLSESSRLFPTHTSTGCTEFCKQMLIPCKVSYRIQWPCCLMDDHGSVLRCVNVKRLRKETATTMWGLSSEYKSLLVPRKTNFDAEPLTPLYFNGNFESTRLDLWSCVRVHNPTNVQATIWQEGLKMYYDWEKNWVKFEWTIFPVHEKYVQVSGSGLIQV